MPEAIEKQKRERRRSIAGVMLHVIILIGVLVIVASIILVSYMFYNDKRDQYGKTAFQYTRATANLIDGDMISTYIETGEKDHEYEEIQSFMDSIATETDAMYFYVFAPQEETLIYVWDTGELENRSQLGDEEPYSDGGKEQTESILVENPPEDVSTYRDPTYGFVFTAASPVFDSEGNAVAVVAIDLPAGDITHIIMMWVLNLEVVLLILIVGIMIFSYYLIRKQVVRPIVSLKGTAENMVDHISDEKEIHMDLQVNNELGDLANSFEKMYAEINNYINELQDVTKEKERIGAELNVATQIQADMLPRIFPFRPDRPEFDLYASMTPAKEVGGDFYDFFMVDENHLAIAIGDVSGKGVPAALFMVISKTLIKNYASMGLSPEVVFEKANNDLCESNEADLFTTAWLGILELDTGKLVYTDAGHEIALLIKTDGSVEEICPKRKGLALAVMEEMEYELHEMTLLPGERLLVYTDGVPEATDANDELFGMERLEAAIKGHNEDTPEELLVHVRKEVDAFVKEAPQFDDLTMLSVVRR